VIVAEGGKYSVGREKRSLMVRVLFFFQGDLRSLGAAELDCSFLILIDKRGEQSVAVSAPF